MKRTGFYAVVVALGLTGPVAMAATPAENSSKTGAPAGWAQETFKNTCSSCHGADGATPTDLPGNPPPIIAGQYRDYLIQALTEYRDGDRKNPLMSGQAAGLSDAQIKALAAYISSLPGPLRMLPKPGF